MPRRHALTTSALGLRTPLGHARPALGFHRPHPAETETRPPLPASGTPGEVTQAALDAAIAGTAQNPTSIAPLSLSISDPPTQAEVQSIVDAYNALLSALQR